jgi:hypothetical protein
MGIMNQKNGGSLMGKEKQTFTLEKKEWSTPTLTVIDVESGTMAKAPGGGADETYS